MRGGVKMLRSSTWQAFIGLTLRDVQLAFRQRSDLVNPLLFFLLVCTLFPLGVSPNPDQLALLAAGVVWIAALLATLLSLDHLFRADAADGTLEQLLLSPHPLFVLVMAKVLVHWLTTGFLLTLVAPVLALMLYLPDGAYSALFLGLLLGTPLLSLIGAIGAALVVGLRGAGVLLSLLVLPLYVPVLILGTGAVMAATAGLPYQGHLLWLAVLLVLAITLAPVTISAALRISLSH